MAKIRIAIAGIGNCASALIQGISFYSKSSRRSVPGLMHPSLGGYSLKDIEVVAAFDMETRLQVEDSYNSAGVVVDMIRCLKIALDRRLSGPLIGPSAYFCKHPPRQFFDEQARQLVEEFTAGKTTKLHTAASVNHLD